MRSISISFIVFFISLPIFLIAQSSAKMSREEYVEEYKGLAMKEMVRTGVPASITLAQGMLESDNGNSRLAVKANNHFGIKCHNGWSGREIYHDDDLRGECFRKYKTVYESYEDHSDFLRSGTRYSFLFGLDPVDYKAWAKGLKQAGYATNPEYADKLIGIIEDNKLHQYDLIALTGEQQKDTREARRTIPSKQLQSTRPVYERNRIDYIIVKEGDTYESLQRELGLLPFEIFKYNDISRDSLLYTGREIYIQPKRAKAARGNDYYTVKPGETMYGISQLYGVKLERLYIMNLLNPDSQLVPDQKISLRKKLKSNKTKSVPDKNNSIRRKPRADKIETIPDQNNSLPEKPKIKKTKTVKETINPEKDSEEKIQFEFR
jgi:LysM repeat protein